MSCLTFGTFLLLSFCCYSASVDGAELQEDGSILVQPGTALVLGCNYNKLNQPFIDHVTWWTRKSENEEYEMISKNTSEYSLSDVFDSDEGVFTKKLKIRKIRESEARIFKCNTTTSCTTLEEDHHIRKLRTVEQPQPPSEEERNPVVLHPQMDRSIVLTCFMNKDTIDLLSTSEFFWEEHNRNLVNITGERIHVIQLPDETHNLTLTINGPNPAPFYTCGMRVGNVTTIRHIIKTPKGAEEHPPVELDIRVLDVPRVPEKKIYPDGTEEVQLECIANRAYINASKIEYVGWFKYVEDSYAKFFEYEENRIKVESVTEGEIPYAGILTITGSRKPNEKEVYCGLTTAKMIIDHRVPLEFPKIES